MPVNITIDDSKNPLYVSNGSNKGSYEMCAVKNTQPEESAVSISRVYLVSATCVVLFDTDQGDFLPLNYSAIVIAGTEEEARLVSQQSLLNEILKINQLYSGIQFDQGGVTEIFQDELKDMMKTARKLPKGR